MTNGSAFGTGGYGRAFEGRAGANRPGPDTRVGDAERQQVVDTLIKAHGLGQLDLTEFDERSAQAWNAKTHQDLVPLTADLPDVSPALRTVRSGEQRGWAPPTAPLGWLKLFLVAAIAIAVLTVVVGQFFFFWPIWLVLWLVLSGRVGGHRGGRGWQHQRAYQRY